MIYFITDGEFVKIGTAVCLKRRMNGLIGGNARKLEVLATCEGGRAIEVRLHRVVQRRTHGTREWFRPSPQLDSIIKEIEGGGGTLACLTSIVEKLEAERAEARAQAKAQRKLDKVDFRRRCGELFERLCQKHGPATVAAYTGQSLAAVETQRAGKFIPGSLVIARLGGLDHQEIDTLMGVVRQPPKPVLPDLRAAQIAINALICRAERIAA